MTNCSNLAELMTISWLCFLFFFFFFFGIHQIFCRHSNLELFKGDACDVESFVSALEGKDAVVSALGVFASIFNPTTFYSESMHAMLEGMKR